MKIIILGTGGVGGYYGGLLARHGQDVTFIARGAHLEAIRQDGLLVRSVHGDFHIQPAQAADTPEALAGADLVLVCTKTYDSQAAVEWLKPALGAQTSVLSLQNGLDAAGCIGAVLGMEHMLAGTTWISASVESPGVIRQVSQFRRMVVGELDGSLTPRLRALEQAFAPTGITFELVQDIQRVLWTKFMFIAAASGMGGLTRLPPYEFRQVPETRRLLTALIAEVDALARRQGVALDADLPEKTLAMIDASAPPVRSSFQRDLESGKLFELEAIIGVIVRQAQEVALPVPVAESIYAALLPALRKAGG
jgi:2-dehydropantoate 2-reductase